LTPDWNIILNLFKYTPGIAALLIVIYLMYKLLLKKEESLNKIIELNKDDQRRNEKILTLLEILTKSE
jgi:hypothetical protein